VQDDRSGPSAAIVNWSGAAFVAPLTLERAEEWWRRTVASADGRSIVLVARDAGEIVGTALLTLDAKRGSSADHLYRKLGWTEAGTIPAFAFDPDGATPHDAVFFYKEPGRGGDRRSAQASAGSRGAARDAPDFSRVAREYSASRPGYPAELFAWLAAVSTRHELAWDAATGSGQAAVGLAEHFDRVIGTDGSEAQVLHARPHPRVEYRVARSEGSGLPAESVDLVAVASALHWFDLPSFYDEARRVCRRGGVLAVCGPADAVQELRWPLYLRASRLQGRTSARRPG
jgi:Methyltransferase domain